MRNRTLSVIIALATVFILIAGICCSVAETADSPWWKSIIANEIYVRSF